jgi:hypothetical protein
MPHAWVDFPTQEAAVAGRTEISMAADFGGTFSMPSEPFYGEP